MIQSNKIDDFLVKNEQILQNNKYIINKFIEKI